VILREIGVSCFEVGKHYFTV